MGTDGDYDTCRCDKRTDGFTRSDIDVWIHAACALPTWPYLMSLAPEVRERFEKDPEGLW